MSLLKLPLIILDVVLTRISASPPNPALPIKAHIIPDWRERFLKSLAYPSKIFRLLYWTSSLIETVVILANRKPSSPISALLLRNLLASPTSISSIRISAPFLLGISLTLVGTIVRMHCYRTLGKLFTFELSIMKDHTLITTGPYAYVRHPSYTGLIVTIVGGYLSHISEGSWVRESGLLETTVGLGILVVFITIGLAVILSLLLRIPSEDMILRRRFGVEWEEWARRVPYKIVPGIY
ncbi:hypothetical protein CVT25_004301 [Psilocybe cyanescens]|uniref:Protein-S-isoprenylcysteine O-methyltransferase n=1 Tax=Psilocybe cyanescens TaxID=93625 RepID=A0A409VW03_PSICY|nr:hypothetical protein CVT25_004301 [Psilocybe cyanescens]